VKIRVFIVLVRILRILQMVRLDLKEEVILLCGAKNDV
jgi:hypothetical protein